jgi:RNA polymerase sigma-70 factor (ECF subfamily)
MAGSPSESEITLALSAAKPDSKPRTSAVEAEVLDLFDGLRDRLLRYLLSFSLPTPDAEEIIQEAFLALFQHLQRGKSRRNLRGWLFRVAHNLALRKRYQGRRDSLSALNVDAAIVDPAPNPEDQFAASQTSRRLSAVLDTLPEQDKRCLILRAEGLRYREIAEVLGMSLGSVSASLGRSLAHMGRAHGFQEMNR